MSNSTENNIESIIYDLTVAQINDLILEVELETKLNVVFYYIVDPDDISRYCFPFGLNDEPDDDIIRRQRSEEKIADEQIAYFNTFTKEGVYLFIMNQHYDELINFQDFYRLQKNKLGKEIKLTLDKLLEKFEEQKNYDIVDLNLEDIPPDVISMLYAVCINAIYTGREKFNLLMEKRKIIIRGDSLLKTSIPNKQELLKIFRKVNLSGLTKNLFEKIKKIKENEIELDERMKIQYNLHSILRDFKSIDRLIHVNTEWVKKINKKRSTETLFLYLSNTSRSFKYFHPTTFRNKHIINNKIYEEIRKVLPNIKFSANRQEMFNPHRTPAQLYLKMLLSEDKPKSNITTISKLELFRDYLIYFKQDKIKSNNELRYEVGQLIQSLNKKVISRRQKLEDYLLIKNQKEFKDKINYNKTEEKLTKSDKLKNYPKIKELILNLLSEDDIKLTKKAQNFVDANFYFLKLGHLIQELLNSVKDENSINKLDIIGKNKLVKLPYQSLPILFLFNLDSEIDKWVEVTNELIRQMLKNPKSSDFVNIILKLIDSIDNNEIDNNNYDDTFNYLCIYILMILPKEEDLDFENSDVVGLSTQKIAMRQIKLLIDESKDKSKVDPFVLSNYLYLGAWINRRNESYFHSRSFTKEGKRLYPNDPRFFHSEALLNYCNFVRYENENEKIKALKESIKSFVKAEKLYRNLNLNLNDSSFLKYCIQATLNSISYICTRLVELNDNSKNWLQISRKKINSLKGEFKKHEIYKYEENPSFNYTEADLEYFEAKEAKSKLEIQKSIDKIKNALTAVKRAIYNDKSNAKYAILLQKIIDFEKTLNE